MFYQLFYNFVSGPQNIPLIIIQYKFLDGVAVPIKLALHENSVNNLKPFCCTQVSTHDFICTQYGTQRIDKQNLSKSRRNIEHEQLLRNLSTIHQDYVIRIYYTIFWSNIITVHPNLYAMLVLMKASCPL